MSNSYEIARGDAANTLEYIKETVNEYRKAVDGQNWDEADRIRELAIQGALEISVRNDWHAPGFNMVEKPTEYFVLLSTGGPAIRLIGTLNEYCEPETSRLEYQNWGIPWTEFIVFDDDAKALVEYASFFWFGE